MSVANHFRSPLTTVCHRHNFDLCIRQRIAQSLRDVFSSLARGEDAFELIGGDENSHSYNFNAYPILSFRAKRSGVEEFLAT